MKTQPLLSAALVAAVLLGTARSAQAQRAVSTRPTGAAGGVARTPVPPPPPPPPPSSIMPPAAPPSGGAPSRPAGSRDTTRRDTIPVLVPVTGAAYYPVYYNGNFQPIPGGYVSQAPPPPQMENPGLAPYPAMAWIPGHNEWNGSQYTWRSGQWVYLPAGYTQFVPGKWESNQYGWYWLNGYWR